MIKTRTKLGHCLFKTRPRPRPDQDQDQIRPRPDQDQDQTKTRQDQDQDQIKTRQNLLTKLIYKNNFWNLPMQTLAVSSLV